MPSICELPQGYVSPQRVLSLYGTELWGSPPYGCPSPEGRQEGGREHQRGSFALSRSPFSSDVAGLNPPRKPSRPRLANKWFSETPSSGLAHAARPSGCSLARRLAPDEKAAMMVTSGKVMRERPG